MSGDRSSDPVCARHQPAGRLRQGKSNDSLLDPQKTRIGSGSSAGSYSPLNAGFWLKPAFKTLVNRHVANWSSYKAFHKNRRLFPDFSSTGRHLVKKRWFLKPGVSSRFL